MCDLINQYELDFLSTVCRGEESAPALCQLGNLMNTKMRLFSNQLNPFASELASVNMSAKIQGIEKSIIDENPSITDVDLNWQDAMMCSNTSLYNIGYNPTSLISFPPLKGKIVKKPYYLPPYLTYIIDQDLLVFLLILIIIYTSISIFLRIRTHNTISR